MSSSSLSTELVESENNLDYCFECDEIIANKHFIKHCYKCNKCHVYRKFLHCKSCKLCIDVYSDKDYIEHRRRHTI